MDSPRTPEYQKITYVAKTPRRQHPQKTIEYVRNKKIQKAATKELVYRMHNVVHPDIANMIAHHATKSTQKTLF